MKKLLIVGFMAVLLGGCEMLNEQPDKTPPTTEETEPKVTEEKPIQSSGEIVEKPPLIIEQQPIKTETKYSTNWEPTVVTLVKALITENTVDNNNLLLLDTIKNSTGQYFRTEVLFDLLTVKLQQSSPFSLVSRSTVNAARKTLGLPADDTLTTKSKVIGLARNVGANYILYTVLTGSPQQPKISMQLMLTNSGELVWSKSANTTRVELKPLEDEL